MAQDEESLPITEVLVSDPKFSSRLLRGFYDSAPGWKWTGQSFAISVDPPEPPQRTLLYLDFTVPDELLREVKTVTVTAKVKSKPALLYALRLTNVSPIRPAPSSAKVAGSGTTTVESVTLPGIVVSPPFTFGEFKFKGLFKIEYVVVPKVREPLTHCAWALLEFPLMVTFPPPTAAIWASVKFPLATIGLVSLIVNRIARALLGNVAGPHVVVVSTHRIRKSPNGVFAGVFTVWGAPPATKKLIVPNVRKLVPQPGLPANGAPWQIKTVDSEKVMSEALADGTNATATNRTNKTSFARMFFAPGTFRN